MNTPQDNPTIPDTSPPPLLVIDWGVEPQAGKHLSPKFHLVAPGHRERPQVTAILDRHLDHDAWNANPSLCEVDECHWSFFESLDLTRDGQVCRSGQFVLELQVVFPQPAARAVGCYRAAVRVTVPDDSETANPILEIRANDSSLLNLQGLDINRYARIVVEGGDQAVINVAHIDGGLAGVASSDPAAPSTNQPLIVQLPLQEYRELQRLMPHRSVRRSAAPLDAASLVFDDGSRIQLVTRPSVVMGRDRSESAPSDIMLRLFPLDDNRWCLTRLISRQHVRFSLCPEGLAVEDCRATCGTYLDGRRLTESQILSLSASGWTQRHSVDVAGVLGLDITLHHDRGWDEWASCSHTGDSYYAAVAGCDSPLLWRLAARSRIDAVRVCRRDALPIARYLDQLEQILLPDHRKQCELVKCAAEAIERTDKLASREQYVFVYRTAELGGADEAAIRIPGLGLNEAPARILNLGGGFWLEGLTSGATASVNDRPVAKRGLIPLDLGDRLRVGDVKLTFAEFQQVRA